MNSLDNKLLISPFCLKLLLLSCLLLVLPHIGNLKAEFITISLLLLSWKSITVYFPKYLPPRWLLLPLALFLALFILKSFAMSFGRDASSSLLVVLLALKLFECRVKRDVVATVFIGFFVLITPFLFQQTILLALYSLCVFLLLLCTLIINISSAEKGQSAALFKLAFVIMLQAVPLMLVGFLLFPRMIGPLWALPDDGSTAISGISDTINPGQISQLALSSKTAFRVTFNKSVPPQQSLYWRGPVFYETDGQQWNHQPSLASFKQAAKQQIPASSFYTIIIEPHQQKWLYSLDLPIQGVKNAKLSEDHQLLMAKKLNRTLSYHLSSSNVTSFDQTKRIRKRALSLPKNTSQNIVNLAASFKSKAANDLEVVQQALSYFNQQQFFYTLSPPKLGKDPNDEFLFTTKRGFCSHYASSFTVLMRAAGIPTRIVAGYHGGIYNKVGGFLEVRQADAHVWTEVWLDKKGWTRIDPTAAVSPDRVLHSIDLSQQSSNGEVNFLLSTPSGWRQLAQQTQWILQTLDYYWQSGVLAYGPENQKEFLSGFGLHGWEDMIKWLSILSAGFIFLLATYLSYSKKTKTDKAQQIYLSFCKRLAKRYGKRAKQQSCRDYFSYISQQNAVASPALEKIAVLYLDCRYGSGSINQFKKEVTLFKHRK